MIFNPSTVRGATVSYAIYRKTDTNEVAQTGTLEVTYKNGGGTGEKWALAEMFSGDDCGVVFSMTDAGQIQYTSSSIDGTNYTGEIRFYAKSISQ